MSKRIMSEIFEDLPYVEIVYDDGDYIEPSPNSFNELNYIDREINARNAANNDGYVLSLSGRVLDFKPKLK